MASVALTFEILHFELYSTVPVLEYLWKNLIKVKKK